MHHCFIASMVDYREFMQKTFIQICDSGFPFILGSYLEGFYDIRNSEEFSISQKQSHAADYHNRLCLHTYFKCVNHMIASILKDTFSQQVLLTLLLWLLHHTHKLGQQVSSTGYMDAAYIFADALYVLQLL